MRWNALILACMIVIILCPLTMTSYCINCSVGMKDQTRIRAFVFGQSGYIVNIPIHISNDTDFADQASLNSWDGNGSAINPYIIERLNITTSGIPAIEIENTTVFFEIRSCLLVGGSTGVLLQEVVNANVWNNTVLESDIYGVLVTESDNVIITNNTIQTTIGENSVGLYSLGSNYCEFSNNTIQDVNGYGILADYTSNCSIIVNFVSAAAFDGIRLRDSSENNITHNEVIHSNMSGIKLGNSHDCRIERNLVSFSLSDGISIEASARSIIQDNVFYESGTYSLDLAGDSSDVVANTFYRSQMQGLRCQSHNNYITQNNFIENNVLFSESSSYLVDLGTNNDINGNYYDLWTWPDENADDIVDRAYPYSAEQSDDEPHVLVFQTDLMHILTKPRLIYPNETLAGEKFWGPTPLIWSVSSDTFGHDATYNVSISADGGSQWIEIAYNLSDTRLDWISSESPESDQYRFKIDAQCTEGLISDYTTGVEYEVKIHRLTPPTILTPNGGETISGTYAITWSEAVESWGLPVTYRVQYSQDAGNMWNELVEHFEDTTFVWDISGIPDGNQYLVRVVASNEVGFMSDDVSDSIFTISRPNITIIAAALVGGSFVVVIVLYLARRRGAT